MIFVIKKVAISMILPPGIFIMMACAIGFFQLRRKDRLWMVSATCAIFIYALSIPVTGNRFIASVEYPSYDRSQFLRADCIVVPGGGVIEGVSDLSGMSIPSQEAAVRTLDAVRLYRIYGKPIIVSGGSVAGSSAEAYILARFLTDLGVPRRSILIEDRSRDTAENAEYTAQICAKNAYRSIILVTSSYHARRAERLFSSQGLTVLVYPSGRYAENAKLSWIDFLPSASALHLTAIALKERMGTFAALVR
jgi:uncharacterized SAM-binding protein YcdF (DUF218 family)